ncbi:hypothetical protein DNI29_19165 [Hymenobacter sediminis]|uniref:hypothetical protein n=1 Tax=Hymenobacter sediminis TaxID=2218621 RepID=UPI000DA674B3|nr:hypothetical protein [Hymenobacter sediminis]RPD44830.1 hypothetical protein DNI29_19165 [Hymenobacter sediminis]
MMFIEAKFSIGQTVYLSTDKDQLRRLVVAITIRQTGDMYEVACGSDSSYHYDFEMSETADVLLTSSN